MRKFRSSWFVILAWFTLSCSAQNAASTVASTVATPVVATPAVIALEAIPVPSMPATLPGSESTPVPLVPTPTPTAEPEPEPIVGTTPAPSASLSPAPVSTLRPSHSGLPQMAPNQVPSAAATPLATATSISTQTLSPSATPLPTPPVVPTPTVAPGRPSASPHSGLFLEIVSFTETVSRGDRASLSARTVPGASCQITVSYKSGPSSARGLSPGTADETGKVSWSWTVGSNTTPGSWPIVVVAASGGKTVSETRYFTVR